MTNEPPQDDDASGANPFRGTPFEQFFGGGAPDLGQIFSQLQSMMQPYDGPLNWDVAVDMARKTVAQQPDPSPSQKQNDEVADAVRLADHWLDETTQFPSGVTSTAAWSRAEGIGDPPARGGRGGGDGGPPRLLEGPVGADRRLVGRRARQRPSGRGRQHGRPDH